MRIEKITYANNTSRFYVDGISCNGFVACNLYINCDNQGEFILGSGTFVKDCDSEKQLIELIKKHYKK